MKNDPCGRDIKTELQNAIKYEIGLRFDRVKPSANAPFKLLRYRLMLWKLNRALRDSNNENE